MAQLLVGYSPLPATAIETIDATGWSRSRPATHQRLAQKDEYAS